MNPGFTLGQRISWRDEILRVPQKNLVLLVLKELTQTYYMKLIVLSWRHEYHAG